MHIQGEMYPLIHKTLIINIALISILLVWFPKHKLKIKSNQLIILKSNPMKLKKDSICFSFFYIIIYLFYRFLFEQLMFFKLKIQ